MIRGRDLLLIAMLVGAGAGAGGDERGTDPDGTGDATSGPASTGLVERAEARLVQIDVNLTGPRQVLDSLTRDDFRLTVGTTRIDDFEVDKMCRDPEQSRSLDVAAGDVVRPEAAAPGPVPTLGPTTFLFYFDQQHLTLGGRQESIDILKQMVPELIKNGNRGTLVSNGRKLETLVELSEDPGTLLAAIDDMQGDFDHFDPDAQQEERRVSEILGYLGLGSGSSMAGSSGSDYQMALTLARQYYQEELWRVERNLRRFSMVLGTLATVDRPKAVVYFADNIRRRAGEHYLDLFGEFAKREASESMESGNATMAPGGSSMAAQHPFDQLVNQAAAFGVRFYPIEGQGLETTTHDAPSTRRFRESEGTLRDLAAETGGEAFLNGVRTSKILEKLEADLSCIYVVSFVPSGLPEDVPQKVVVGVDKPRVKVQSRGRVIIQSESARKTSRLMAAFTSPKSVGDEVAVYSTVVPTGFEDGRFTALVQVSVPGSEIPASTWDLGASILSRGKSHDASGRLTVTQPGAAVVLQEPMSFAPGPYEVVGVAHNTTADAVGSEQIEGEWPKRNAEPASLGPIAVVQPTKAAILRGQKSRSSGYVAYAEKEPVLANRPVTVVALVCKADDVRDALLIERQLVGASQPVSFKPMEVDLGKDPCVIIHDKVKAGTMTPGSFRYRIQVYDSRDELVRGERRFFVWDGRPITDSSTGAPAGSDG